MKSRKQVKINKEKKEIKILEDTKISVVNLKWKMTIFDFLRTFISYFQELALIAYSD